MPAKKEEKTTAVRKAPIKKKGTPATTPTARKKTTGKPKADADMTSTTLTGGADRTADSLKAKRKSGGRSAPSGGGKMDRLKGFFKKGSGAKTTPRNSRKDIKKAPETTMTTTTHLDAGQTEDTVQSENSNYKREDEKTKMLRSRGKKDNHIEKAKGQTPKKAREKPSVKKPTPASTPRKEGDTKDDSKEPTMEVDDEGESKLIVVDRKTSGKKGKTAAATTPQHEVERKEREGMGGNKEKVTPRKKASTGGNGITMYEAGNDKVLAKLAALREMEARGWEECERDFAKGHRVNPEVNRDTRYVISFNVPPDGDFYDANKVDIPGVDTKFILAAAPTTEISSRESFWRMVYDSNVASIFYIEKFDAGASNFVPWKAGESKDYGKMFVANKKSTASSKDGMQSVLEVLPEGCSNSIIVRFVQCVKWPETMHRDANKYTDLQHPVVFTRLLKDDKSLSMVVCSTGCGKSAMFVMLHAAITTLNSLNPIPLHDLLFKIRTDRWGSIQTLEQYLCVYQMLIYYIAAKSKKKSEVDQLCTKMIRVLTLYKK